MKRAEMLALAERLANGEHFYAESSLYFNHELARAVDEAAAILRKIAEAHPVAWCGHGVITGQPFAVMNKESCSDDCGPWLSLYSLQGVLDD